MQGEIIAEGLTFPEGPVWVSGALYCTEIGAGTIARWDARGVARIATTGGGPNGATLGRDGALWVTQNGGMSSENRVPGAIQRVDLVGDGAVSTVVESVAGLRLEGPNDLAFGPDGRLHFTDPRGASDPTRNRRPGRIFAYDIERKEGELLFELEAVFPNGIGFARDGTLIWTESFTRRVMARVAGRPETLVELPERHFPDGFCVDAAGRLYVASTYGHCVTVLEAGKVVERLMCGDGMPTNCCFGGTDLYVTESRRGTLWRFRLGVQGLPLHC